MSRITQFTNPLGVFTQTYDPGNLMPKTLTAPNGLTTTLETHPAAADLRLKEIASRKLTKKARLFNENPLAPGIRVGRVGAI